MARMINSPKINQKQYDSDRRELSSHSKNTETKKVIGEYINKNIRESGPEITGDNVDFEK